jgi:hypothetical protein
MSTQTVERTCEVDVALRWGTGYDTVVQSFCNVVATGHGGTHQNGFERALLRSLNEALKSTRVLRANDDPVLKDDVLEGLTAVVTVKVPEPQYLGQTKDELGTPGVSKIVADVVGKELKAQFLDNRKRKAQAPHGAREGRRGGQDPAGRQGVQGRRRPQDALETSTLPAKLADCRSTDVGRTELWLVEGDSRSAPASSARNSEFQALLPPARQDPQRPEGRRLGDAEQRRVRVDHPGGRRRHRAHLRPRADALRQGDPDDGRRRRRRPHPLPAHHAVRALHAPGARGAAGCSPRCRPCTGSRSRTGRCTTPTATSS